MVHLIDDLYIGSDKYCLMLLQKKIVQDIRIGGKRTREDKIGTYRFETLGYYSTLTNLIDKVVRMKANDSASSKEEESLAEFSRKMSEDLRTIRNKVNELKEYIEKYTGSDEMSAYDIRGKTGGDVDEIEECTEVH